MKQTVLALVTLLFAVGAGPIDQLDRFAGTWQTQGTFVDTAYSKAATASGTTTCAWSMDRAFMICQQSVAVGGKSDHDVAIYSYDDATSAYRFYNVHAGSSTSATITIAGEMVTYPFSFTDKGKTVSIRTLNVWKNPNAYDWRSEFSTDDGKTWTLMASGTSTRS
jgi:hypothetical protein